MNIKMRVIENNTEYVFKKYNNIEEARRNAIFEKYADIYVDDRIAESYLNGRKNNKKE